MYVEKTKNLLTFADGPKEGQKEKKKGGGGRVRVNNASNNIDSNYTTLFLRTILLFSL